MKNAQRGRYREFMQCDFDILGTDSAVADAEVLAVAAKLVRSFFGEGFALHVNSRGLLRRFLEHVAPEADMVVVLRSLDKLRKIGADKVIEENGSTHHRIGGASQVPIGYGSAPGYPGVHQGRTEQVGQRCK